MTTSTCRSAEARCYIDYDDDASAKAAAAMTFKGGRIDHLCANDVSALAAGAGLLGSGGGGDVALGLLLLRGLLQDGKNLRLVSAKELPPDTMVIHVGLTGSPDVVAERPPSPDDFANAVMALATAMGQKVGAIGVLEIGGVNALLPLVAALILRLPVVDGDLMGRAFPRLSQTTLSAAGHPVTPMSIVGTAGDTVIIESSSSINAAERMVQANVAALGGAVAAALYPCRADILAAYGISDSISTCVGLGRALTGFSGRSVAELAGRLEAQLLCGGRVDEIRSRRGGVPGSVTLSERSTSRIIRLDMLDEYLNVTIDGVSRASVPDVLVVLDSLTLVPMPADRLRLGQPVDILKISPLAGWSHEAADRIGLAAFGIDPRYVSGTP